MVLTAEPEVGMSRDGAGPVTMPDKPAVPDLFVTIIWSIVNNVNGMRRGWTGIASVLPISLKPSIPDDAVEVAGLFVQMERVHGGQRSLSMCGVPHWVRPISGSYQHSTTLSVVFDYPDSVFIVAGDFNHIQLKTTISKFHQMD